MGSWNCMRASVYSMEEIFVEEREKPQSHGKSEILWPRGLTWDPLAPVSRTFLPYATARTKNF